MKSLILRTDPWKLCLLLLSITFYLFFYADILLAPNTTIIANVGDSTKNYYTYLYQVVYGHSLTNFNGLNYPYGEHVVFTDGQPLLTFILYFLPFLKGYALGIMNLLVLFSFIVMPQVIYKLLVKFSLPQFMAFSGAFAVTVLSPQILRLTGHFSLAYAFIFPLLLLKLVSYFESTQRRYIIHLFLLNFAVFWLHPYTGFAFTFFTVLALLIFKLCYSRIPAPKTFIMHFVVAGVLPIVLFKLLMLLTDQHGMRYDTPYGYNEYNATAGSVFIPYIGPFKHFMSQIIPADKQEFEGLAYIGICTFFTFIVFILLKLVFTRRLVFPRWFFALLIPAVCLLLLSFGLHLTFGDAFTKMLGPIKQFRALGRFAWLFYYVSAILCFVMAYRIVVLFAPNRPRPAAMVISVVFLALFTVEAIPYHQYTADATGFKQNRFMMQNLDENEKALVKALDPNKYQAIITLPFFHIGSEYFSREPNSYVDAMMYAYQSGIPLVGNVGSRTAISETKSIMGILNPYADKTDFLAHCTSKKEFAVIALGNIGIYDEREFLKKCTLVKDFGFAKLYSINITAISQNALTDIYREQVLPQHSIRLSTDSSRFLFQNTWNVNGKDMPYVEGTPAGYTMLYETKPGDLLPGEYVFSCRYFYDDEAERINNNLIVERMAGGKGDWPVFINTRSQSGIMTNFIVCEALFNVDDDSTAIYRFLFNGYNTDKTFRATNVLVRRSGSNILETDAGGHVVGINNYPISAKGAK